jgi:hypothetical protein
VSGDGDGFADRLVLFDAWVRTDVDPVDLSTSVPNAECWKHKDREKWDRGGRYALTGQKSNAQHREYIEQGKKARPNRVSTQCVVKSDPRAEPIQPSSAGQVVMSGESVVGKSYLGCNPSADTAHRTNRSDVTFPQMSGNVGKVWPWIV